MTKEYIENFYDPVPQEKVEEKLRNLKPIHDLIFRKCFGEVGREKSLLYLVNNFIKRPDGNDFKKVEFISRQMSGDTEVKKSVELDITAILDDEYILNIEAQKRHISHMIKRSYFYQIRMYSKQMISGEEDYNTLKKVAVLNFVDQDIFKNKDYHHIIGPTVKTIDIEDLDPKIEEIFEDIYEIHFIQIPVFAKYNKYDLKKSSHRIIKYLNEKTTYEERLELVKMDSNLKEIYKKTEETFTNPLYLSEYELKEKELADFNTTMRTMHKEGREEGRE
ncbi:MAG: Rpn family recombination-promoting nuclease/putative transposase [Methanobrevibacter sp.]|jgi:predicted transposase/invertase (TIGR01784 family)|nr:Rpn family recombination-promoting nuclease/putative transposase [Methanobrevibacter sp.]